MTGFTSLPLVAFSFFPALDVVSDILYIVNTDFYNVQLFITCFGFLAAPSFLFFRVLYEYKALRPSFLLTVPAFMTNSTMFWLGITSNGYPTYHGTKLR